jgi:hypothetical protein
MYHTAVVAIVLHYFSTGTTTANLKSLHQFGSSKTFKSTFPGL